MEGLETTFAKRSYDMSASVGLKKIEIEDCMELCPEFKYLATSHFEGAQQDLISISFVQTERVCPCKLIHFVKVDLTHK